MALKINLKDLRVAILATDMVEEAELVEPRKALTDAGATTELISPRSDEITCAKHFDKGVTVKVDQSLSDADPDNYDAIFLPGGALNADHLRMNIDAQNFARAFDEDGRPVAVICHAPWLLVSAGLVRERRLTSFHTLQDDIRNAGGYWVDAPVILDINWLSSRFPGDIPQFNKAMLTMFADLCGESEIE